MTPIEEHARTASRGPRIADALLALAVLAAIAVALSGVAGDADAPPEGAVAVVNGQALSRAAFEELLGRVGTQLGHAPDAEERAGVLSRLVDEELLLQQGLALDLPRAESRVRAQIVQEVIRQAVAGAALQPVTEAELQAFHAENRAYFRRPATLRAARFDFADAAAAREFSAALTIDPAAALGRAAGARSPLLSDAPMGEAKLRDYLGSESAAALAALAPGTALVQDAPQGGATVLVLLGREQAQDLPFAAVRAQVEAEYRRRRDEAALEDHVRGLRESARIVLGAGG